MKEKHDVLITHPQKKRERRFEKRNSGSLYFIRRIEPTVNNEPFLKKVTFLTGQLLTFLSRLTRLIMERFVHSFRRKQIVFHEIRIEFYAAAVND